MPVTPNAPQDPTLHSRWRPLHSLLAALDREIEKLYQERGVTDLGARYTMPLIRLGHQGSMTIRQLSESIGVTHSAMSQTISVLRRDGYVTATPGSDGRTRHIALTDRARELVPFLEAEWRATEAAIAELDEEIPYPVTAVVHDIEHALGHRSFRERVSAHLSESSK